MKRIHSIAALLALLVTAGCAGTPIRYLTLDMAPSGKVRVAPAIQVDAVELSDALRRPELLVLARPTEIEYYSDTHWVSNLTELITEKLEAEFNTQSDGSDPFWIRATVWQFCEDETAEPPCGRVKLTVDVWAPETPARDEPDWSHTYDECTPVEGEDVSDVAAALSKSLEVIASQIGSDISRDRP